MIIILMILMLNTNAKLGRQCLLPMVSKYSFVMIWFLFLSMSLAWCFHYDQVLFPDYLVSFSKHMSPAWCFHYEQVLFLDDLVSYFELMFMIDVF